MTTQKFKWVRFHELAMAEDFFFGKFRYSKSGFFTGHAILDGNVVFIFPWRKIRSTRPFGKVRSSGDGDGDRMPLTRGGSEKCPSA